jgi:F-type H+-transporting ATPase subunit delta
MESKAAGRYAKSLLDLAEDTQSASAVFEDFSALQTVFKKNRELAAVLNSPIISGSKKAAILNKLFKGKVHKLTYSFFDLLNRKHRESQLAAIVESFIELYNLRRGLSRATVISAVPLTPQNRSMVQAYVERVSGKKIELDEKVDASIIGGLKIKIGDLLLDSSIATQLKTVQEKLTDKTFISKF